MKHKYPLLCLSLMFWFLSMNGQFEGIHSFYSDTVVRAQLKANRVSSVTETVNVRENSNYKGRYFFDTEGRVIEINTLYGTGQNREKREYFKGDLIGKRIRYDTQDTTKIVSWESSSFDEKGRRLKEEKANIVDGEAVIYESVESKVTVDKKRLTCMETNNYGRKLNSTTYTRDSIDGIYRYIVSYEYRPEDIDEKGRKHGEKMVWRYYTTDYCLYEDHVEYSVFGSIEVAKKISSSYYQRDEKGRLLESGNINYEEVYMDFVQEHPEDFNLNYYSPLFVKAVFEGKVQGQRKADLKCVYDAKGLLLEKQFYGSNCKYKYNDKGEITEVVCDSEFGTSTQQFWYNENGLISKTIHIPNRDVENAENDARECVYNYTYY